MYAIAAVGLLTIILSCIMIASPAAWSRGILRFSEKSYFHIAEVMIRLVLGAVFIYFGQDTRYPLFVNVLGFGLLAVGLFLIVIGPKRHTAFAEKSATFTKIFRPAGFFSFAFGIFLIWILLR